MNIFISLEIDDPVTMVISPDLPFHLLSPSPEGIVRKKKSVFFMFVFSSSKLDPKTRRKKTQDREIAGPTIRNHIFF